MLGLWARERTGRGQYVETSMLSSAGYIHSGDLVQYDGRPPIRLADQGQHGLHALYRLYACREGWLFLAARGDREWSALAHALEHPEWLGEERFATAAARLAHDDDLARLLHHAFGARGADEWESRLVAADVAAVRAGDVPLETWFEGEGRLIPEDHPAFGPFWRAPVKVEMSDYPPRLDRACALGEHTRPILEELGYTGRAIDQLVADGIVVESRNVQPVDAAR